MEVEEEEGWKEKGDVSEEEEGGWKREVEEHLILSLSFASVC